MEVKTLISPEEYLLEERKRRDEMFEYLDGYLIEMSGASLVHNRIVKNLLIALESRLAIEGLFEALASDMRVHNPVSNSFFYPDVVVIPQPPQLLDHHFDTVLNPQVIFEVLSESTADFDKGEKFEAYQTLPSLKEYVLISQKKGNLGVYQRLAEREWKYSWFAEIESSLSLPSLSLEIPLSEIFKGV